MVWVPSCKEVQLKRFSQTWSSLKMTVATVTGESPSMEYDADEDMGAAMVPQTDIAVPGKNWVTCRAASRRGSSPLKVYVTVDPVDPDTVAVFLNSSAVPPLDHPGPP